MLNILYVKINEVENWLMLHTSQIQMAARFLSRVKDIAGVLLQQYRHKLNALNIYIDFILKEETHPQSLSFQHLTPVQIILIQNIKAILLTLYNSFSSIAQSPHQHLLKIKHTLHLITTNNIPNNHFYPKYAFQKETLIYYQSDKIQKYRSENNFINQHLPSNKINHSINIELNHNTYKSNSNTKKFNYIEKIEEQSPLIMKKITKQIMSTEDQDRTHIINQLEKKQELNVAVKKRLFEQKQCIWLEQGLFVSSIPYKNNQMQDEDSLQNLRDEIFEGKSNEDSLQNLHSQKIIVDKAINQNNETAEFRTAEDSILKEEFSFGE